ncbi:MAG: hypothetical protein JWQ72_3565, partial [Polaromonas sp.]|nr:hypothetical protein [Polaromonas sp.]
MSQNILHGTVVMRSVDGTLFAVKVTDGDFAIFRRLDGHAPVIGGRIMGSLYAITKVLLWDIDMRVLFFVFAETGNCTFSDVKYMCQ